MREEKTIEKAAPTEVGEESIGKLLKKYAVPAIIAMTASSLYNMVDSIFIGQGVGSLAISGLAVTFPLMNISAAFGSLVGVGASALVSMLLGQRNYERRFGHVADGFWPLVFGPHLVFLWSE